MSTASMAGRAAACLLALGCASAARGDAATPTDLTGTWLVEDGNARVEVAACGESLCGTIVWLQEPHDEHGNVKLDIHNPDETLRSRRVIGLEVLRVSEDPKAKARIWRGTIYDPEIGKTYRCKAELRAEHDLKIRGFIGVSLFGRTTHWTRVDSGPDR